MLSVQSGVFQLVSINLSITTLFGISARFTCWAFDIVHISSSDFNINYSTLVLALSILAEKGDRPALGFYYHGE